MTYKMINMVLKVTNQYLQKLMPFCCWSESRASDTETSPDMIVPTTQHHLHCHYPVLSLVALRDCYGDSYSYSSTTQLKIQQR